MSRFVLAHGFTQTARSWRDVEERLSVAIPNAETMPIDLPGHGDSLGPSLLDLWSSADRLVELGGVGTYVGYSMGGRVALHAALAHPDAVTSLVLIGATAGIDDPDERGARREADELLADRIEAIGVEAFVDEWLSNALFAGLTDATAHRIDRYRNTAAGLATSLRSTGTGTQQPLWDRLNEITAPVLLLVGEDDSKFTAIAERMRDALRTATLVVIPGAGHSVHLEQPDSTVAAIATWHQSVHRGA